MDAYLHPVLDFSLECVGGGQFAAGVLPSEESESGRTAISCRAIAVPFFCFGKIQKERRTSMNSNDIFKLLDCVGRATARKLPEIVEPLPVCGKTLSNALSAVRQGIDDYRNQRISPEEYGRIQAAFHETAREEAAQAVPPAFMDCVIFQCKPGCTLTDAQQGMLADALEGEAEEENDTVIGFISRYMGGSVWRDDDYYIGDDYVSLNFMEYDEYPYDGEALSQLQEALNEVVGCEAFQYFVASGHEESHGEW